MKNKFREPKGIQCALYYVNETNDKIEFKPKANAIIKGKILCINQVENGTKSLIEGKFSPHVFDYSFNIAYNDFKVLLKKEKESSLNAKVIYNIIVNEKEMPLTYYTHLSFFNKIILSCNFKRLWIRQSSNIMWLINILVAVLAAIATLVAALSAAHSHCNFK